MSAVLWRKTPLNHFRGVTKVVPQEITQRKTAAGRYQRTSRQGILDDSNGRRVTEESSATAQSVAKATIKDSLTVQIERFGGNYRGILGSSKGKMNQLPGFPAVRIGRAFSPAIYVLPLNLGRCPRLVSSRAFGPQIYVSSLNLGRCPRLVSSQVFGPQKPGMRSAPRRPWLVSNQAPGPQKLTSDPSHRLVGFFRAKGAASYQPGASPQENRPPAA